VAVGSARRAAFYVNRLILAMDAPHRGPLELQYGAHSDHDMNRGAATLSYAVRVEVLAKYLGQLSLTLALLTIVPLTVAGSYREFTAMWRYLVIAAVLGAFWAASTRLRTPKHIQTNEALVIVALAFVMTPLIMSFALSAGDLAYIDVLFEAVSGITTTGLTTISAPEALSPAFLFARSWMQWYGGLGIVVLSIALLVGHHAAARRLAVPEPGEQLETTARAHARRALSIYAILTAIGIALIWLLTGEGLASITHVLSAVSTGGFSSFDDSLAGFDSWLPRFVLIILALAGAIPLALYVHGPRTLIGDIELRALLISTLLMCLVLGVALLIDGRMSTGDALRHALVMGISTQTTTGFSTLDVEALGPAVLLVMILAMAVGGTTGSTAGGIKQLRVLVFVAVIRTMLHRASAPRRAVIPVRLGGEVLEPEAIERALILVLLFAVTVVVSWFAFVAAGYPALDALFEVTSATGTVGLSTGITRPELESWLKGVLMADMLLGRVEIIALLLALYPPTWFGRRMHEQ
jgi:trk system potassium uptake protein TrkH